MARSISRNWLRLALATGVALQALLAACPPAAAQNKTSAKALTIIQSVTGLDAVTTQLQSSISNVGFGSSGANGQKGERQLSGTIVSVPSQVYGNGALTQDGIVTSAKVLLSNTRANSVAAAMKSFMASNDVQAATFIYQQQVRPQNSDRDLKLQWQVTVTDSGRVLYSTPKVTDADPTIVYLTYTSSAVSSGLPPSWAYTGGGRISWQLRRPDGTATTNWVHIETNGAYNEPADGSNPDLPIFCLASAASSSVCPSGYTDALTLMSQTSSTSAVIDYVRQVQPVYSESVVAGAIEYIPSISVSFDSRVLNRVGCNAGMYRNTGRIGYTLKTLVDRYSLTDSKPTPTRVNQFTGTALSPTQNFDLSKEVAWNAAALTNQVINPLDSTAQLVDVSSIPGVQYLAGIQATSNLTNANNLTLQTTQSDMATSWVPGGAGNYNLYLGTFADNYWRGYGAIYDRSLTFNLTDKSIRTRFTLAQANFDDWLWVKINGSTVYVGPYGGDRLAIVTEYYGDSEGNSYSYDRVQYCDSCFGWPELSRNWSTAPNVDMRPYLVSGQNTIWMRTIVAGAGEGAIRIDATSCLAE